MGIRFRAVPSRISERSRQNNPAKLVRLLALRKAQAVSRRYPNHWVLGADTVVVCGGRILGKPKDPRHAAKILGWLNGKWHNVYTGIALARRAEGFARTSHAVTRVKARRVNAVFLLRFSRKHLDKAGAYSIQDRRDPFIQKIQGPVDNVIGLPRRTLRRLLLTSDFPLPRT